MDANELMYLINGAIFEVNREIGSGFLETQTFSSAKSAEENVKMSVWVCG